MDHGAAYGNTGTQLPNAQGHDVFLGLSCAQKRFFETLDPDVFDIIPRSDFLDNAVDIVSEVVHHGIVSTELN